MRAALLGRFVRDTTAAFDVAHSAKNTQSAKSKEQFLLFVEKILLCCFIPCLPLVDCCAGDFIELA